MSLDEARAVVLEALGRAQRAPRRARDVMSTPPRSVGPDDTVRDAMTLCQRHGQSGVFVVEGTRVVGGVSREDLDKAVGHDLAHAPVRGIMSSHVASAPESATVAELQALVTSAEDGRVAVLRDDELVGVVSRSDLLRVLEGVEPAPVTEGPSLADELRALDELQPIVEAVATLGDRTEGVYLVGGTLRDILLGEESFDIDIAVEGDAIAFARSLAAALGGRFTPHDKFGTAIVSYGDGGATRRRDHANRVLRLTWRASDGRARGAARGPPAPRLHDQRDGGVPQARGFRAPGGSLRRTVGPGSARAQGAAQPLFHRRPDEDLPRDPLRGTLRSPLRRPHDEPRAGVRRDGPRRGSLVGAVAGRARAAARGSGRAGWHRQARGAGRRPGHPSASAKRPGSGLAVRRRARCGTSSRSRRPCGGSGSPCWLAT